MKKWLTGILCVLALTLGLTVSANAAEIVDSGYCGGEGDGTNLSWMLDSEGTLTISGTGVMENYHFSPRDGAAPWYYCKVDGHQIETIVINSGVNSVGDYAFFDYYEVTSLIIPESVTSIGTYAFYGCSALTSAGAIGSSASYQFGWKSNIPSNAFSGCTGLKRVSFSDSINSIEAYAFNDCINLVDISVPNGATEIEEYAFWGCIGLKSLAIPNSISKIGFSAFGSSRHLTDIYFNGNKDQWEKINIDYLNDPLTSATIHFSAPPGYNPDGSRAPTTVSTSTGTSKAKAGAITVEFKGGVYEKKDGTTDMSIRWGFSLFDKSSDVPQNDLAIAALVLSANANAERTDQVKKTLTETQYTINEETKETRNGLGFSNFAPYNYDGYDGDLDRVGYVLASKVYHNQNIIAIVCRGTVTGDDILSDFVTQADGFRRAANNVMNGSSTNDSLAQYIAKHNIDTSLPTKYFITGHSRGGAVANILGQILSDSIGKENVYVYTFACPNLTTESNRADYTNIHNIVNTDDLVPTVPPVLEMVSLFPLTPPVPVVTYHPKFGEYYEFTPRNVSGYDSCFRAITGLSSNVITDLSKEFEGGYSFQFVKLRNHAPAVYMSFLRAEGIDGMVRNPQEIIKGISVRCPVDVLVYDGNGNYLGAIRDNVPDNDLLYSGVYAVIEGDEKYLYVLGDTELSLELVGTDTGTMTYSVEEIDAETGEAVNTRTFSGVALSDGKTMTSAVTGEATDTQLLVTENGEVSAMVDENGGEADAVLLSFVTGLGSPVQDLAVAKGESVSALPEPVLEGYRFTGWCTDEDLTVPFDQTAAVTAPMTLYASYEEALPVYGLFTDVRYDGTTLTATLRYDYNRASSDLYAALYQDGQMLDVQSVAVASGAKSAAVSFTAPDLSGAYTLKAFTLDGCAPISTGAVVSFFAD